MSQRREDGGSPSLVAVSTLHTWGTSAVAGPRSLHCISIPSSFAPVGVQPLKPLGSSASFEDRVAMTELAIKGLPAVCDLFADAPDPQRRAQLHHRHAFAAARRNFRRRDFYTLIGADSLLSLAHWYRGAEVPFVAPLIVASRPGQELEDLAGDSAGGPDRPRGSGGGGFSVAGVYASQ